MLFGNRNSHLFHCVVVDNNILIIGNLEFEDKSNNSSNIEF